MKIQVMKIAHEGVEAKLPTRATEGSAGLDLYAAIPASVTIPPQGLISVPTGVAVGFPVSACAGFVFARSGLAMRHGIALSNGVGVIDSDYTGEIVVGLCNLSDRPYTLEPGERFAQLVIMQIAPVDIEWTDTLSATMRSDAGFGSTGRF
jgi:deoxyuridine 5''-triphosphate nucleotidohydrolase (dut)